MRITSVMPWLGTSAVRMMLAGRSRARSTSTCRWSDLWILNYYDAGWPDGAASGQGREQAIDRRRVPVVSVSIGDTARFQFGGSAVATRSCRLRSNRARSHWWSRAAALSGVSRIVLYSELRCRPLQSHVQAV